MGLRLKIFTFRNFSQWSKNHSKSAVLIEKVVVLQSVAGLTMLKMGKVPLSLTAGLELVRICQNCQGCPNADHSFGRVDLVRLAKNWQGWT